MSLVGQKLDDARLQARSVGANWGRGAVPANLLAAMVSMIPQLYKRPMDSGS